MKVVKGEATALGHSFQLVGFEADVPFEGFFVFSKELNELTLHITNFFAEFKVDVKDPEIHGWFKVEGWVSAIGTLDSSASFVVSESELQGVNLFGPVLPASALALALASATVALLYALRVAREDTVPLAQRAGPAQGAAA